MEQLGKLKPKLLKFIITFCGVGLLSKKMPGTVGSLFATMVILILPKSFVLTFIIAVCLFFLGWWCCELYIPEFETNKDPSYVVIDEACGLFIGVTIIYLFELNTLSSILLNFVLFRVFDILKPFPIKSIEKYCKNHNTTVSFGIMIDDVVAAIIATFIQIILALAM